MFWRATSRILSFVGLSRKMSGKRLVVGVLCTVCVTLGLYLGFFNHQSADELLKANRQDLLDNPIPSKPNFHHLKSHQHKDRTGEDTQTKNGNKDAQIPLLQKLAENRTYSESKVKDDVSQQVDGNDDDDDNDIDRERVDQPDLNKNVDEDTGDDDDVNKDPVNDEQGKDIDHALNKVMDGDDVPVQRVGEDRENEDEENEELRQAGGNGGENVEEEEENIDGGRETLRINQDGRGPHGIKIFDWDKWVKDNDFVELGNIWGYCDDAIPPVIGKVLLLEDKEQGGLKNIIIFNTSLDYDVVLGSVEVSIEYDGVSMYTNTFDFEDLETEADFFICPVAKGDHYFVREQHIPSLIPKGEYYGEAKMLDQNNKVIVCSQMHMRIN